MNATDALTRLQDGNQRYVQGNLEHPNLAAEHRQSLEGGQKPFAIIVGCADSRVIPEMIFDQGIGDLFVIRVAGNVIATDVVASVEYAVDHLGTKLVLVMGHTNCGAVAATLGRLDNPGAAPPEVLELLDFIEPAVKDLSADMDAGERLQQAVEQNVQQSVQQLSAVADLQDSLGSGLEIKGAVYHLGTGEVSVLD